MPAHLSLASGRQVVGHAHLSEGEMFEIDDVHVGPVAGPAGGRFVGRAEPLPPLEGAESRAGPRSGAPPGGADGPESAWDSA